MENQIRIINTKFIKAEVSKNPEFSGKLKMSSDINIKNIEKVKDSKEVAKIHYSFKVDYAELGKILLEGFLFISSDQKTIKNLTKNFEDKKYDSPDQIALTNIILQKASIKAIELEDEFGLPIHIKLPLLNFKK